MRILACDLRYSGWYGRVPEALMKRPRTEVRTVETQRVDPPRDRTR